MIVDCFPFFNELDLLEIRLTEHWEVVDRFVLLEAPLTHQGKPKPLYFQENAARFDRFGSKIEHRIVTFPQTDDPWVREHFQREAIRSSLNSIDRNAMVFISDLDEIYRPQAIKLAAGRRSFNFLQMDLHYYYLDMKSDVEWVKAYCAPAQEILQMKDLSTPRHRERLYLGDLGLSEDEHIVKNAGWHLSWLGGVKRIITKLESYAHTEHLHLRDPEMIASECAVNRFFITGVKLRHVKLKQLPSAVRKDYVRLKAANYFAPQGGGK